MLCGIWYNSVIIIDRVDYTLKLGIHKKKRCSRYIRIVVVHSPMLAMNSFHSYIHCCWTIFCLLFMCMYHPLVSTMIYDTKYFLAYQCCYSYPIWQKKKKIILDPVVDFAVIITLWLFFGFSILSSFHSREVWSCSICVCVCVFESFYMLWITREMYKCHHYH